MSTNKNTLLHSSDIVWALGHFQYPGFKNFQKLVEAGFAQGKHTLPITYAWICLDDVTLLDKWSSHSLSK